MIAPGYSEQLILHGLLVDGQFVLEGLLRDVLFPEGVPAIDHSLGPGPDDALVILIFVSTRVCIAVVKVDR